jgi:hypothetical protein
MRRGQCTVFDTRRVQKWIARKDPAAVKVPFEEDGFMGMKQTTFWGI